jgi:hypothetical protein
MKLKLLVFAALTMLAAVAMADFDLGDLPPCNYPTFYGNPAHSMSGKAWLGECITQEDDPHAVNEDECDDGVQYLDLPWMPCTMVTVNVTVTAGPNYEDNPLWLNGWKDGNMDGDFCDTLCDGTVDEWIVQNVPVTPGQWTFSFMDPGVLDMGIYPGVFRWRLSGRSLGRNSFGFYDPFDCPDSPMCGNFGADSLGEVEDYWIPDAQLAVEINGFDAVEGNTYVTLRWSTASEASNDHFDILRDGEQVGTVVSAGNTTTGNSYEWTDHNLANGRSYQYTLVAVDVANNHDILQTLEATPEAGEAVASDYELHQNYPNPFNPSTSISFNLRERGHVNLRVFNTIGQQVALLVNSNLNEGQHSVTFDASGLPSGLYIYRLETNGYTDQKKMLLMK